MQKNYCIVIIYWDNPWLIFSKEPKARDSSILKQVFYKIQTLRHAWTTAKSENYQDDIKKNAGKTPN